MGIQTGLHYPLPVHLQNCHRGWGYQAGSLPITECAASEILSLPMFPGLTAEQQARVAEQLLATAEAAGCKHLRLSFGDSLPRADTTMRSWSELVRAGPHRMRRGHGQVQKYYHDL